MTQCNSDLRAVAMETTDAADGGGRRKPDATVFKGVSGFFCLSCRIELLEMSLVSL